MPQTAHLVAAHRQFHRALAGVTAAQWPSPTPCAGWTVADLVDHVVNGEHMTVALLDGATAAEALATRVGVTPAAALAQFDEVAAATEEAFEGSGALERTVHHMMGELSGGQLLGFRITDLTLHGWDLARATGGDEALDPALVASIWEQLQPIAPMIGSIGVFGEGPSGTVGEGEDPQRRLLDLTGRRP